MSVAGNLKELLEQLTLLWGILNFPTYFPWYLTPL